MLRGWHLHPRKKGGSDVGRGRKGRGSTIVLILSRTGIPVGLAAGPANMHETRLVIPALEAAQAVGRPERLIGDRAYDSRRLHTALAARGVRLIAPHRKNRRRPPTQDGRSLRRCARRWKIEGFFACLKSYRRISVRYEFHMERFFALVCLACSMIILRKFYG